MSDRDLFDAVARKTGEDSREIARRGHFIGNHTMDHLQLPLVNNVALDEQIAGMSEAPKQGTKFSVE